MGYNITLAIGVLILIIALMVFKQSLNFLKTTQRADATVVEVRAITGGKGTTYKPIFSFKALDNQQYTYVPNFSSNPSPWKVGDVVTIAYMQDNPVKAKLVTYFGVFSWAIILAAIAMPLIVIGGGYHFAQQFLQ